MVQSLTNASKGNVAYRRAQADKIQPFTLIRVSASSQKSTLPTQIVSVNEIHAANKGKKGCKVLARRKRSIM